MSLARIDSRTAHSIRARAFVDGSIPSRVKSASYLIGQSANSTLGFREEAGLRMSASNFSRPRMILNGVESSPWSTSPRDKSSFNLYFRDDYEDSSITFPIFGEDYPVDTFEQLRPRAGKNDINNPHMKDEVMRRLFIDMGNVGSRGIFNSLYVNGEWKGFYNTCERLREPFLQAHYPNSGKWDIRQAGNPDGGLAEGDNAAWDTLNSRLQAANVNRRSNWESALELVDPVAMADYFLLNIYGATWDWPQNNWVSARERSSDGRYRFYVWDAEGSFGHPRRTGNNDSHKPVNYNTITEFSPLLAERSNQSVDTEFWRYWSASGSSRRSYLLGPNDEHFRDAGYWPETGPPSYNQHGGEVSLNFPLSISSETGIVYYTLDGSDPRDFGNAINPAALTYNAPFSLPESVVAVKSRLRSPGGEWSALTEAEFKVGLVQPTVSNLVISEIHYHPGFPNTAEVAAGFLDHDDFEFLQLRNIGNETLALSALSFTGGIAFDSLIAGQYFGGLSNGGERLTLALSNTVLRDFSYDDTSPWPACTDGDGLSLVLRDPSSNPDHAVASNWAGSAQIGGLPGGQPRALSYPEWQSLSLAPGQASGPTADPDGDGLPNLVEFFLGSLLGKADAATHAPVGTLVDHDGEIYLSFTFTEVSNQSTLQGIVEVSDGLESWTSSPSDIEEVLPAMDSGNGSRLRTFRATAPVFSERKYFVRLRVLQN